MQNLVGNFAESSNKNFNNVDCHTDSANLPCLVD